MSRLLNPDLAMLSRLEGADRLPVPPDPRDDEFEGDTFDTGKWSWMDQGDTEAFVRNGQLTLSLNENANRWRGIYQEAPSGSWEFTAKVAVPCLSMASRFASGIFCAEDASGEVRTVVYADASVLRGLSFSSPSSSAGGWGPTTNVDTGYAYLRVAWDETDIVASFSNNGFRFVPLASLTPGYTPSLVGLGIRNQRNHLGRFGFGWFRRTA